MPLWTTARLLHNFCEELACEKSEFKYNSIIKEDFSK